MKNGSAYSSIEWGKEGRLTIVKIQPFRIIVTLRVLVVVQVKVQII